MNEERTYINLYVRMPYDEDRKAFYLSSEHLIDRNVNAELREQFWTKYGPDLYIPNGNRINCPVLASILHQFNALGLYWKGTKELEMDFVLTKVRPRENENTFVMLSRSGGGDTVLATASFKKS